jgi:hypothetical protein
MAADAAVKVCPTCSRPLGNEVIVCCDCWRPFELPPGERDWHLKHFGNRPRRCPSCRMLRRNERAAASGGGDEA